LAANVYEGMFILDSNRFARDHEAVSGQIPTMVEKLGGEMLVSRLWEERRLAYPIKGQRKGTYWLTYFRLDSRKLVELRRQCQITDDIVRFLFLKEDPRIVDALVAHARTAPVPSVAPSEAPVAGDAAAAAVPVTEEPIEGEGVDAVALDEEDV
jgi:small subunit ribosomal protein S6